MWSTIVGIDCKAVNWGSFAFVTYSLCNNLLILHLETYSFNLSPSIYFVLAWFDFAPCYRRPVTCNRWTVVCFGCGPWRVPVSYSWWASVLVGCQGSGPGPSQEPMWWHISLLQTVSDRPRQNTPIKTYHDLCPQDKCNILKSLASYIRNNYIDRKN